MDRGGGPERESQALLRAAWKVALDEAVSSDVSIQVTIKGAGSWLVDTPGGVREALATEAVHARIHLTYASTDVFLGLAYK